MKILLILILSFLSIQAYSQLYRANKGGTIYFTEVRNDSAKVEIYHISRYEFVRKAFNDVIPLIGNDSIKTAFLTKRHDNYILTVKDRFSKRWRKIRLKPSESDNRRTLRNQSYSCYQEIRMRKLEDSLSGPYTRIRITVNDIYRRSDVGFAEQDYSELVDKITDSLTAVISQLKNPEIDLYYQKTDSITLLDTDEINNLLSNANYQFQYSNYLLYKVALERPKTLIDYIESNPANKKLVLRAIRNHNHFKEITKSVKRTEYSSKGKKEIVNQKQKRIMKNVGTGAANITLILLEFAGFVALGIWIF
jgi:excinuclease UvrABC helicase subunit UvrB